MFVGLGLTLALLGAGCSGGSSKEAARRSEGATAASAAGAVGSFGAAGSSGAGSENPAAASGCEVHA